MGNDEKRGESGLFRSVSRDGAHWLLAIVPHEGWAITRDGARIVAGTGHRASLDSGVRKFMALTVAPVAARSGGAR